MTPPVRILCPTCRTAYDPTDPEEAWDDGSCLGCHVPDIHDPAWAGHGRATSDVTLAAPDDVAQLMMGA